MATMTRQAAPIAQVEVTVLRPFQLIDEEKENGQVVGTKRRVVYPGARLRLGGSFAAEMIDCNKVARGNLTNDEIIAAGGRIVEKKAA